MSDANDTRAANDQLLAKEQSSLESAQELMRNFHHRVAMDGTKDFNALQYLQGIAANTFHLGIGPKAVASVHAADTDQHLLVHGYPGMRIVLFDLFVSINAAANITFEDAAGNNLLATMYAPNAGQGFVRNSVRGIPLPAERGLYVQASAAESYSVDVTYNYLEIPND